MSRAAAQRSHCIPGTCRNACFSACCVSCQTTRFLDKQQCMSMMYQPSCAEFGMLSGAQQHTLAAAAQLMLHADPFLSILLPLPGACPACCSVHHLSYLPLLHMPALLFCHCTPARPLL